MQPNLNLLATLDALLDEGSIMGAADRLRLSQPAVSRALGRLRALTGDEILVRSGRIMVPTPYANGVRASVHDLVQTAADVLSPRSGLDLPSLHRTFTIRGHDVLLGLVATNLCAALAEVAPGVQLRLIAETPDDTNDLERGRADLALGGTVPSSANISHEILGVAHLVVVLAPGNPLNTGELTVERYVNARHLVVSRRGRLHDQIDEALAARGLKRAVIAAVPTGVDALRIVQRTDAVAAIPDEASRTLIDEFGLVTRDLPVAVPAVLAVATWHRRNDSDPAHRWLREKVKDSLAAAHFTGTSN